LFCLCCETKNLKKRKFKYFFEEKTSKYYGVSKIGKRFRAMFGGKYIGMADKEIDAARMVNEACKTNGVAPKNNVSAASTKVTKIIFSFFFYWCWTSFLDHHKIFFQVKTFLGEL
jgi:hypothetical protein